MVQSSVKIPERYNTSYPRSQDHCIYMEKKDFLRFVVRNDLPIFYHDKGILGEYTLYGNKIIYSK